MAKELTLTTDFPTEVYGRGLIRKGVYIITAVTLKHNNPMTDPRLVALIHGYLKDDPNITVCATSDKFSWTEE